MYMSATSTDFPKKFGDIVFYSKTIGSLLTDNAVEEQLSIELQQLPPGILKMLYSIANKYNVDKIVNNNTDLTIPQFVTEIQDGSLIHGGRKGIRKTHKKRMGKSKRILGGADGTKEEIQYPTMQKLIYMASLYLAFTTIRKVGPLLMEYYDTHSDP